MATIQFQVTTFSQSATTKSAIIATQAAAIKRAQISARERSLCEFKAWANVEARMNHGHYKTPWESAYTIWAEAGTITQEITDAWYDQTGTTRS